MILRTKSLILSLIIVMLMACASAEARQRIQGYAEQGGQVATIGSASSTNKYQRSYPNATVTVYLSGTTTKATIYSNSGGTVKANPFTANANGFWHFYVDDGRYDIRFSGGGIAVPFTWADILVGDSGAERIYNIKDFGAACNGSADDTAEIQAAIDAATSTTTNIMASVYVPPSITGCRVTAPLTLANYDGFRIFGAGINSIILNDGAAYTFDFGDIDSPENQDADYQIDHLGLQACSTVAGNCTAGGANFLFHIRGRETGNMHIHNNSISGPGAGIGTTGALKLELAYGSRIYANTFGSFTGKTIQLSNSANGIWIGGNRIDGTSNSGSVGIEINNATQITLAANITEGIGHGVSVASGDDIVIDGNYCEANVNSCINVTSAEILGLRMTGIFDASDVAAAIDVSSANGLDIGPSYFVGNYSSGAPIRIGSGTVGARIGDMVWRLAPTTLTRSGTTATWTSSAAHGLVVGQRVVITGANQSAYNGTYVIASVPTSTTFTYTMASDPGASATGTIRCSPDAPRITFSSVFSGAQYVESDWDDRHGEPKNLLAGSFSAWPGGTAAPPGLWEGVGAGTYSRQTDAPYGRYSLNLNGSGLGIQRYVFANISSTENAELRGKHVVFGVWAKADSAAASIITMSISDGVGSTSNTSPAVAQGTDSWTFYAIGRKLDYAATTLIVTVTAATATQIRIAAPALYVGQPFMYGQQQPEVNSTIIELDGTSASVTGTTDETDLKSTTLPARTTMGAGGRLRIRASGTTAGTNAQKDIKLYFGGVVIGTISVAAAAENDWIFNAEIISTGTATQRCNVLGYEGTAIDVVNYQATSVNTNNATIVKIAGDLANTGDTITVTTWSIEPAN